MSLSSKTVRLTRHGPLSPARPLSVPSATLVTDSEQPKSHLARREARLKSANKEFYLDVLRANASSRDVRPYLAKFKPVPQFKQPPGPLLQKRPESQTTDDALTSTIDEWTEPLRTAVVLLKLGDETVDDEVLEGLGTTLHRLTRLGLNPIIVLQPEGTKCDSGRGQARKQASRVVTAIEKTDPQRALAIENGFTKDEPTDQIKSRVQIRGSLRLSDRNVLLKYVRQGIIPVIAPLRFDADAGRLQDVPASEAVLALVRGLTGLRENALEVFGSTSASQLPQISLDKIIILDSHGGLPSSGRSSGNHIFVNLEQEYDEIEAELLKSESANAVNELHTQNLKLVRDALALLPPTSSAIIATPSTAATNVPRGQTFKKPRNPLIHNLLTDKPLFSSSLPQSRLAATPAAGSSSPPSPTLLKRGMSVTILPDPKIRPWGPPTPKNPPFSLSSPDIDLPSLIDLIEDSFQRPLDAQAYLSRINPILAGIVVAGAWEGCAILTWEPVPSLDSQSLSSPPSSTPSTSPRAVPYLDKLAVRRSSQGAGGVADLLFNAMVRDCFPQGVVWRSRTKNPVNGYYFERARGSWRLPEAIGGHNFTMFWTSDVDSKRFAEYAAVCMGLGSFFKDGKGGE